VFSNNFVIPTSITSGTDVLAGTFIQEAKYPRRIRRIAVVGGANCSFKLDIFYGNRQIGTMMTTDADNTVISDESWFDVSGTELCPPGVPVHAYFNGTIATTVGYLGLDFAFGKMTRRTRARARRMRGRRRYRRY